MVIHDCTKKLKLWGGYHIYENNLSVRKIKVFLQKKLYKKITGIY